jgi:hypothetical protein
VQSYDLRDFYQGVPRLFTSDADREYEVGNGLDSWNYSYSVSSDSGASHGLGFRFTRQADTNLSVFCVHIWEKEFVDGATIFTDSETLGIGTSPDENPYPILGVGLVRGLLSNDRQYLACAYDCGEQITGVARYFGSSRDAITLWHTIQPTRDLIETDSLDLIPKQLHKYLRYYALHMAFARPGQGYRPDLADHFDKLYSLGVLILKTLGTPTFLDRNYAREQINDVAIKAVGRVRFPSTFERTAY